MESGKLKMGWARQYMPVLGAIRKIFEEEKPLTGVTVGMALHVEAKTAVLVETLAAAGAEVYITGCNPLSTQDDVATALDQVAGVHCFAKRACSVSEYYEDIDKVLDANPTITIDDGMDLIHRLHTERREQLDNITGGCEETTTGIHRLRAMANDGELKFPVIAVNDTPMKRCFDNVHGTGESALSSIMVTTNALIGGKYFVVAGYGYCGRGLAKMAHGLGAKVIVTEIDPRRALEAHMDGYHIMSMEEAAKTGDIFVTTTGNTSILTGRHFLAMKNGAILSNAGHFNVEIDIPWLEEHKESAEHRDGIDTYVINGNAIHVLAEGRLVNLATPKGMGHPIEVMDLSFALQSLCTEYINEKGPSLVGGVYEVPTEIDITVASLKLSSLGVEIDTLTDEQEHYMNSWDIGT